MSLLILRTSRGDLFTVLGCDVHGHTALAGEETSASEGSCMTAMKEGSMRSCIKGLLGTCFDERSGNYCADVGEFFVPSPQWGGLDLNSTRTAVTEAARA